MRFTPSTSPLGQTVQCFEFRHQAIAAAKAVSVPGVVTVGRTGSPVYRLCRRVTHAMALRMARAALNRHVASWDGKPSSRAWHDAEFARLEDRVIALG